MYEKEDDYESRTARLSFRHVIFVAREQTADYQTTSGLRGILDRNGDKDDIVGFLEERNLPLDEIGCETLADRILLEPPEIGYLAVINALQWRLLYSRLVNLAVQGTTRGVENLFD
jgi:restriction system protein